jgi:2-alkenal reductase
MKTSTKNLLIILCTLAIAVFAVACTSDPQPTSSIDQPAEHRSESAFMLTAEATTNEAVGMSVVNTEKTDPETVNLLSTDPTSDTELTHSSLLVDDIDGVLITDDETVANYLVQDESLELLAAEKERADWEMRLMNIWDDSISGVVLIELENTFLPGTGAGWFWDDEGHIVTNYHVVRPTSSLITPSVIIVETFDGDRFEAELIGGDHVSDIAVLKIDADANTLTPLHLGDSANLSPGMTAIALGHPFGSDQAFSMTQGIISGLSRSIQSEASTIPIPAVIQTDADMNPGNSGGPLLNSAGEVIGVNTQIRSQYNVNSGVGFATPINLVRRVVNNLIENGVHEYPLIGISSWAITPAWAQQLDLDQEQRGLIVTSVSPDGPAHKAGITPDTGIISSSGARIPKGDGDIIVRIDNVVIEDIYDLRSYIMLNTSPGDEIVIEVLRDDEIVPIGLTLGSWGDQFK